MTLCSRSEEDWLELHATEDPALLAAINSAVFHPVPVEQLTPDSRRSSKGPVKDRV